MATIEQLKMQFSQMQTNRSGFESHWQDIVDYLLPFRQDFYVDGTPGAKKMSSINDSTPTQALLLFASGVSAKMANPAMPWFRLETEDDSLKGNREVRVWLDWLEQIFYNTLRKSNFYTADQEANIDVGGFGTAPIYVGSHPKWGCCYQTLNLAEVYLAVDMYGHIDTLFRKFQFTAKQAAQQWGDGQVSDKVKSLLKSNQPETKVTIIHAVQPRPNRDPRKLDAGNMPFESTYFELDNNHLLEEGGFREFPYCVSRYFAMPGEVFGRSLGMIALPDAKELQVRVRDTTKAGQLRMAPPVLLPHDGFAGTTIRRTPNGFTFVRGEGAMQDKIGVFPVAGDLGWSEQSMEGMRQRIGRVFFSDLMLMAMDKQVTLGEFLHTAQEKMQMLGPFLGRLQTERYNPIFERTFHLLWDQGLIPPPPRALLAENGELKYRVDYISPLAKAQKLAESQSIIQATGYLAQAASARPEVLDILDWDGAGRLVLENYGVPAKLIVDQEVINQERGRRAQQQQAAQAAAMALEAAKTMPALSQGPQAGSPLDQMQQSLQEGAGQEGMGNV